MLTCGRRRGGQELVTFSHGFLDLFHPFNDQLVFKDLLLMFFFDTDISSVHSSFMVVANAITARSHVQLTSDLLFELNGMLDRHNKSDMMLEEAQRSSSYERTLSAEVLRRAVPISNQLCNRRRRGCLVRSVREVILNNAVFLSHLLSYLRSVRQVCLVRLVCYPVLSHLLLYHRLVRLFPYLVSSFDHVVDTYTSYHCVWNHTWWVYYYRWYATVFVLKVMRPTGIPVNVIR